MPYSKTNNPVILQNTTRTYALLIKKLRKLEAEAKTLERVAIVVNERSVKRLSQYATRNLQTRIKANGREQKASQSLVRLVSDHQRNSSWGRDGFIFMDEKVILKQNLVAKEYYRAIEFGSRKNIGWRRLAFYRGGRRVAPSRDVRTDRGQLVQRFVKTGPNAGTERRNLPGLVYVARPVPEYRYARDAVLTWRSGKEYKKIFEAEANKLTRSLMRAKKRGGSGS